MKNKILFGMFLVGLVLVSFVGAEELIISNITDSNYTCLDKLCLFEPINFNCTVKPCFDFLKLPDDEIYNITIINGTYLDNITITPFNITYTCPDSNTCPFIIINNTIPPELPEDPEEPEDPIYFINITNPIYFINITKDITPPIISNVQSILIGNTVYIIWDTDETSYFNKVEYGKGKQYDYSVSQDYYYTNLTIVPKPALAIDLGKSGTYHYKVTSCDLSGNCATSEGYKVKG